MRSRRKSSIIDLVHMAHETEALLELSGYTRGEYAKEMVNIVETAPDPETAASHIIGTVGVQNELLRHKWKKHITQIWFESHPSIPISMNVPLKSCDVAYAPALLEAHGILHELANGPIPLDTHEAHFAASVSPLHGDAVAIRRMSAVLEELRLVRVVKDQFHLVQSRYARFQKLPPVGQFYLLWHVDMYHLDWRDYAAEYNSFIPIFQQYLPMVWEMLMQRHEGMEEGIDELSWHIVRAFRPLWRDSAFGLYEQSLLQDMVENLLVHTAFGRYGLIEYQNNHLFAWTSVGEALLNAERTMKLPCSAELLP